MTSPLVNSSTQSRLATLLSPLIAHRWVQTYDFAFLFKCTPAGQDAWRAIKEESKVANRDWVEEIACGGARGVRRVKTVSL